MKIARILGIVGLTALAPVAPIWVALPGCLLAAFLFGTILGEPFAR